MPSLEEKIAAMLTSKRKPLNEGDLGYQDALASSAGIAQTGLPVGKPLPGDLAPVPQGGSQDAPHQDLDPNASGQSASALAGQMAPLEDTGLATTAVTQSMVPVDPALGDQEATRLANLQKNMSESVSALFDGEQLSEGFKAKAGELFEAAVVARVNFAMMDHKQKLEEQAKKDLEDVRQTLAEQVNAYMTYAVKEWHKENQVAINQGLRQEISEEFMTGLRSLFVETQLTIPDEQVEVVERLAEANDALKNELNESIEKNVLAEGKIAAREKELQEQINGLLRESVLTTASQSMTMIDAEKLKTLMEGVEFSSKELFEEKVALIKKQHFTQAKNSSASVINEELNKEAKQAGVNPSINAYLSAIKQQAR
jgi:hypothetical protein